MRRPGRAATREPSRLPRGPARRLEPRAVGGQRGDFEEAVGRVPDERVAVERLEHGVMLVAEATHAERAAVRLGEGEDPAAEGHRHLSTSL